MIDSELAGSDELPLEPAIDPLGAHSHFASVNVSDTPVSIDTSAGSFEDCHRVTITGGSAFGADRWLCRGIGYVWTSSGTSVAGSCVLTTYELIDFDIQRRVADRSGFDHALGGR